MFQNILIKRLIDIHCVLCTYVRFYLPARLLKFGRDLFTYIHWILCICLCIYFCDNI